MSEENYDKVNLRKKLIIKTKKDNERWGVNQ